MEIIKLSKVNENKIVKTVKQGKIFIYPTDTIYSLGCNALNYDSVQKIREIKKSNKPFSVIAPSKQWVYKNLIVRKKSYIQKLPGPFTFILKMKKNNLVAKNVTFDNTLAIRIPEHKFTKVIQKANVPFVSTSVNISSEKPLVEVSKIPKIFNVDFAIDDGKLANQPSNIFDLTGKVVKIIR